MYVCCVVCVVWGTWGGLSSLVICSWTQARVTDLDNIDVRKFPLFSSIEAGFEVELQAGQVLYLPPFWFHRVKAGGHSISLALWADSNMVPLIQEAFASVTPFEADWTPANKWAATGTYIFLLAYYFSMSSLHGARRLLHYLPYSRYTYLCAPPELLPEPNLHPPCSVEPMGEGLTQKFHRYARDTSRRFLRMTPPAVAEMKLLDFIDDLVSWATSSVTEDHSYRRPSVPGEGGSGFLERGDRGESYCAYPGRGGLGDAGKMYKSDARPTGRLSSFTDSSDGLNPKLMCWALRTCGGAEDPPTRLHPSGLLHAMHFKL
mmetsp:Transcript_28754/g.40100  ORF Transcript_28754/g.40100 Transcript_28754/m.40100 type:complete len:318 (+) Transcript_28754:1029-1982(+)